MVKCLTNIIEVFFLTRSLDELSFPRYEVLRFYSRLFLVATCIVLSIVLGIHAVVYHGVLWAEEIFSSLLWVRPNPNSDDDPYLSQVIIISSVTCLPYAKYSLGIVKVFKKQLFKYLQEKYKTNLKIIDSASFFKKLNKTNIGQYALTDKYFLDKVIKNKADKNKRYGSDVHVDDVLCFPDKKIHITECSVAGYEEEYQEDDDGASWVRQSGSTNEDFTGLLIVIDKDLSKDHIYERTKAIGIGYNFYKVNNNKVLLKSKVTRSTKQHNFILRIFYRFWNVKSSLLLNLPLKRLNAFKKLDNYEDIDKSLSEIAEILNIDYVMEDARRIYLFHEEKPIDFFTFYQNQNTDMSAEIFEDDFRLLLEISKRF